ncbi:uncharacterized protein F4807DRAFT_455133 [Annulohypoxylon truncatum]|uniref:uncharacterized protein n=1 Tax=Annulohypoxylon truncatum TaxID=327061 RepID=UPI0020074CD2|nr:uncharacterized protein F4807DRAFT_455133 [Annulohypoxylon truncatum]KAI1214679.1 hypothetical protein F4807DRAFT_455133 [Annulohypoxylon truncatum]
MSSTAATGETKGPTIIVVNCIVTAISTAFVFARLYVRVGMMKKFKLDDALISFSLILGWMVVAFSIVSVKSGNGQHISTLTPEQVSGAVLYTMVGFVPGVLSFSVPKLAAIYLLTGLLEPSKWHRRFLWTIGVACVIFLLGCVAILFGQCTPSRAQWDLSITQKTCISPWVLVNYSEFAGAFSGFVDLYLAAWPATVLFSLQMNMRKKIALCFALGLGSVACVVAIYKTTRIPGLADPDFTWATSDLTIWTCVEGASVIIATCIPILRPLMEAIFGRRVMGSTGDRQGYKNYGTSKSNTRDELEMNSRRRKVKGPYDLETNIELGKDSSQDDILQKDGHDQKLGAADGIVRTQSVTILYGEGERTNEAPLAKYENWK